MKAGRLTEEEKARRIRQLLGFIFKFRFATRKQLDKFIQITAGLSFPRRIIEASIKQGYIDYYFKASHRCNIYYLTKRGKEFIRLDEAYIDDYRFEKNYVGINTFDHHNMLVEAYFLLVSHLNIKTWKCEWVLRVDKGKGDKIPDGLIVLQDDTKIALEVETSYKSLDAWKTVVELYRYDVEDTSTYHGVLVVAHSRPDYEGIKDKLYNIDPELCDNKFILADLSMLELGTCFYHGKQMHLEEAVNLLEEGAQIHGQAA